MAQSVPAIEIRSLTKVFGNVIANADVSLAVARGSIHGLVGENGAGKSTCMKMLYGLYPPDSGTILVNGIEQKFRAPTDAIGAGIGMVHQHFMLAADYSVLDNIILGAEPVMGATRFLPRPFQLIDRAAARKKIAEAAAQYGLDVPLDAQVRTLTVGMQQRIEILKLLYRNARILILDEPTAVLTPGEIKALFANLIQLRDEGHSIIIITHKLEEVMTITSHVTVLRAGRVVGDILTREASTQKLATMMVGRAVNLHLSVASGHAMENPILKVENLSLHERSPPGQPRQLHKRLDQVNFTVRAGEIVGIAGVDGNGQKELFETLTRVVSKRFIQEGQLTMFDQNISRSSTAAVRSQSLGIIPFDRHKEGLLLDSSATDNAILGFQRRPETARIGILSLAKAAALTRKIFAAFDVRPKNYEAEARELSGGNQQKLIIGRELVREPKLVLAANPIRGVDVGAIEFIHQKIVAARDRGAAVLLFSADLDEVMTLSDRILVMYEGRIAGEFKRGAASIEELGLVMGGGKKPKLAGGAP